MVSDCNYIEYRKAGNFRGVKNLFNSRNGGKNFV